MNRIKWALKEFQWLGRRAIHTITGKYYVDCSKYAGCGLHSTEEGIKYIYDHLKSNSPFAIGRCGYSEMGLMACAQTERYFHSKVHYYWTPSYINGANEYYWEGDNRKGLAKYDGIMREAMDTIDGICCWPDMFMTDAVLEAQPHIEEKFLFCADAVSPFSFKDNPWTKALQGKRVLVVCPFAEDIMIQYKNKDKIWTNGVLPEFDLICDPSIWFKSDPNYQNWFDAFNCLTERVLKQSFDVALLGCGPFGFPLASRIKQAGFKAVHMGSSVQLLFGIGGKRWDNMNMYNEYWIRPRESTKPSFAKELDNAVYW